MWAWPSGVGWPSMWTAVTMKKPGTKRLSVAPAFSTPGTARTCSSTRVISAARAASVGYAVADSRSCAPSTVWGSKPGSIREAR